MKNILVTWGAWFVGSNLCEDLLKDWNRVIALDNLQTGSEKNIKELFKNPKFEFIKQDIIDTLNLKWIDEIYNLACPASPIHYQEDPIHTIKTSFLWALNVLELAKNNLAKVLQASTSEVYWNPLEHPQSEKYWWNVNINWIRSCYDEWKRAAETLFSDYHRQHWVDAKIIRIFNTYWPKMSPEDWRVISNFIMQALNNEDITIYGDWSQTRSFQYVDDLIRWMKAMMNKEWFQWPVNIGTEYEFTIKELAEIILKLIPESKSKIVYKDLPQDDPTQRRANNKLAKEKLGREPTIPLEEWLKKTIEYFKNLNENFTKKI